ncbi:MAG: 50S ribosomal protein L10, partial [Myxococcota bacterium]
MGMTRQAKEEAVSALVDKIGRAKGAIVANYQGLDVASVNAIRAKFREVGAEYRVVKNTLMKRALEGTGKEKLGEVFTGPTAVAFKYDDELSVLGKAAKGLAKDFEKFEVKGAYIDQDVILDDDPADTLSKLPTLPEIQAKLLGLINAPAQQLLSLFNQPGEKLLAQIN